MVLPVHCLNFTHVQETTAMVSLLEFLFHVGYNSRCDSSFVAPTGTTFSLPANGKEVAMGVAYINCTSLENVVQSTASPASRIAAPQGMNLPPHLKTDGQNRMRIRYCCTLPVGAHEFGLYCKGNRVR